MLGHYAAVVTKIPNQWLTVAVKGRDLFSVTALPVHPNVQVTVILTLSRQSGDRFECAVHFDKPAVIPKEYGDRQRHISGLAMYHYMRTLPTHSKISTVHRMEITEHPNIFLGRCFIDNEEEALINSIVEKVPDARDAPTCDLWLGWWNLRWDMLRLASSSNPAVPASSPAVPSVSQSSAEDLALLQSIKSIHELHATLDAKEAERKVIQTECDAVRAKMEVNRKELLAIRSEIKDLSNKILKPAK
jgi:hypothetical protein